MAPASHRNRLASESSAYLLQHASNPVDWYPWGKEALDLAKSLDRPILLSVGYSSCHWCHVMERESFENPEIARLMNAHFVCVKVDREERPDLDHVYMKALQGMTGRGGWPMTMFLTPDGRPFYGGTYFPPEDRGGMPGFPRVLLGVHQAFSDKRAEVLESAQRMAEYLATEQPTGGDHSFTDATLRDAAEELIGSMDPEHGGFGNAPKFPATMALSLLMEASALPDGEKYQQAVRLSLDRMAAGGIRDHLGGGFHRYSVDRTWLVPHFEKMLYDQALLATLYLDAATFFADAEYAGVAEEILDYVVREMTSPEGGFFSAQDADSEGVEGKFFVWRRAEVLEVLGPRRGDLFCASYGVTDEGNFEGQNILHRIPFAPPGPSAREALETELAVSRGALMERRTRRVPPATDRKIVTDWNGLMISAMASGGAALGRSDLVDVAMRAASFLRASLMDDDGLLHVHAAGAARVPGFLDDHAFFGRACLDCFAVRPEQVHLDTARFCADRLLRDFHDAARGGFYFTGSRNEALVARTCDLHDGAVPAGNSVAAELLLRLWSLTGEDTYRRAGEAVRDRFLASASHHPYGAAHLLAVAERHRRGWKTVVVAGEEPASARLVQVARRAYDPACTVIAVPQPQQQWFPPALAGKSAPRAGALAYICEGVTCEAPIDGEAQLRAALHRGTAVTGDLEG